MKTTISENLLSAYRYHRSLSYRPAALPVASARTAYLCALRDVESGKARYAGSPWAKPVMNGQPDKDGRLWVENPAAMGLRFVGYCDEIYKHIGHTGWFTDPYQDSKIRGTVYQLPGRDGKARYVAAHDNEDNGTADCGGPAYVDFSTIYESDFEDEMKSALASIGKQYQTAAMRKPGYWAESAHESARKEAAHAADEFTRIQAEHEREYQTAWQAGNMYSDCLQELKAIRESVLSTIRDMKGACATLRALPESLKARLRQSIESELAQRESIFAKMEKLKSGDWDSLCFYPGEKERAAFNEAAGKVVI